MLHFVTFPRHSVWFVCRVVATHRCCEQLLLFHWTKNVAQATSFLAKFCFVLFLLEGSSTPSTRREH